VKILWFSWKDTTHPLAGGAEVLGAEMMAGLVRDGHEVVHISGGYKGALEIEYSGGITSRRVGNRVSVYWEAYKLYMRDYRDWSDFVVEEVNTVPFFTRFYARQKRLLVIHQLARVVWFYQMPFPLSVVGFLLEPIYLRLLRGDVVATISTSSMEDLVRHGFGRSTIRIYGVGVDTKPVGSIMAAKKSEVPTILSIGSVRPMKRTSHVFEAFRLAKQKVPALKLVLAGDHSGSYGRRLVRKIGQSDIGGDVAILGRVDRETKVSLMSRSHFVLITSVKEGWGLVVTEANSQATPAIVYDVDGLRDSVQDGATGFVVKDGSPGALAEKIVTALKDAASYDAVRSAALEWSRQITFERGYSEFREIIALARGEEIDGRR